MEIHELFVPTIIILTYVHVSGIVKETGTLVGRTVLYLEHWEMYLEHEVTIAEDAMMCIDEGVSDIITEVITKVV